MRDEFEAEDFNPVDHVNKIFPTEQSLAQIDLVIAKVKREIKQTDEEMFSAVREQCNAGEQGKEELNKARKAIQHLFLKIGEIKQKAGESERMVQEICSEIRALDRCKRNLTHTITTLKRFQMFVTAVEQLQQMAAARQYPECAHLLDAARQLVAYFQPYRAARISSLIDSADRAREQLKGFIFDDFDGLVRDAPPGDASVAQMAGACQCLEAMPDSAREELVRRFINEQLRGYRREFVGGTCPLEKTEARYKWLQRTIRRLRERFGEIFPPSWCIGAHLAWEFCRVTRDDMVQVLRAAKEAGTLDIAVLTRVLQHTLEFEDDLQQFFASARGDELDVSDDEPSSSEEEEEEEDTEGLIEHLADADETTPAAIRRKWKRIFKERRRDERRQRAEERRAIRAEKAAYTHTSSLPRYNPQFKGAVSACFAGHLGLFVEQQEAHLHDLLAREASDSTIVCDEEAQTRVFSSAAHIFSAIRRSADRCIALTDGAPLGDLACVFLRILGSYAETLTTKLPRAAQQALSSPDVPPPGGGKLTDEEARTLCIAVNTAAYCLDTSEQLVTYIQRTLLEAHHARVRIEPVRSAYASLTKAGVAVLISGSLNRCAPALAAMSKTNWEVEAVGDESPFVPQLRNALQGTLLIVSQSLSLLYWRRFADKFASSFAARYEQSVASCKKKFTPEGAQQLLVDTEAAEAFLLGLPAELGAPCTKSYPRFLADGMGRVKAELKVVGAGPEFMVETYRRLFDGRRGYQPHRDHFATLLALRGLRNNRELLDAYTRTAPVLE